jgi:hypothetical protein
MGLYQNHSRRALIDRISLPHQPLGKHEFGELIRAIWLVTSVKACGCCGKSRGVTASTCGVMLQYKRHKRKRSQRSSRLLKLDRWLGDDFCNPFMGVFGYHTRVGEALGRDWCDYSTSGSHTALELWNQSGSLALEGGATQYPIEQR